MPRCKQYSFPAHNSNNNAQVTEAQRAAVIRYYIYRQTSSKKRWAQIIKSGIRTGAERQTLTDILFRMTKWSRYRMRSSTKLWTYDTLLPTRGFYGREMVCPGLHIALHWDENPRDRVLIHQLVTSQQYSTNIPFIRSYQSQPRSHLLISRAESLLSWKFD